MNRNFENIFDKYNIPYKLPRKRKKITKNSATLVFRNTNKTKNLFTSSSTNSNALDLRHELQTTCNSTSNTTTQFYVNTSTQGKYCRPTRYSTLNLIRVETLQNQTTHTLSGDCFNNSSEGELEIKENISLLANEEVQNSSVKNSDIDLKRKRLSCSLNLGRRKKSNKNYSQIPYKQLNLSVIPKRSLNLKNTWDNTLIDDQFNKTLNSLPNSSPEPSQTIDPFTASQDTTNDTNTELDLLIDLIQQEDKKYNMRNGLKRNTDILSKNKKPLKGGYEEMFERALKREKISGSFLKHDRKIGLRYGKQLSVVRLETTYGVTIAVVKSEHLNVKFGIVIAPDMVPHLEEDTIIEAFFDEQSQPYKMKGVNNDLMDVYFEPYKLLVV